MKYANYLVLMAVFLSFDSAFGGQSSASFTGEKNDQSMQDPDFCSHKECGPMLGIPNYLCADGITLAGPGACKRDATGQCGYEIVRCPE